MRLRIVPILGPTIHARTPDARTPLQKNGHEGTQDWIPASAGMTEEVVLGMTGQGAIGMTEQVAIGVTEQGVIGMTEGVVIPAEAGIQMLRSSHESATHAPEEPDSREEESWSAEALRIKRPCAGCEGRDAP